MIAPNVHNVHDDGDTDSLGHDVQKREELAFDLILSLPRSNLASLQRKLRPLLKFDILGSLPTEIALHILAFLSANHLIICAQVSRRWKVLGDDSSLWKALCSAHGWEWRHPTPAPLFTQHHHFHPPIEPEDDEGMGDSDREDALPIPHQIQDMDLALPFPTTEFHSSFASLSLNVDSSHHRLSDVPFLPHSSPSLRSTSSALPKPHKLHYSAPPALPSLIEATQPDYKRLYLTHTLLQRRFRSRKYKLSALQTKGAPYNSHTHAIYCLQLYTHPSGNQVLFTGSRDRTVREWNLSTGLVDKVISDLHGASILSLCVAQGYLATAGGDRSVSVFDLQENKQVKIIHDHLDSVLCVRFNESWLVSCSKDWTLRIYQFPSLNPQFALHAHKAAVNAVAISGNLIVSASGDRAIRLWDAPSGTCLHVFDGHSSRGIASLDFAPPYVLSGSSDKHLRYFDFTTLQGWSTHPGAKFPRISGKKSNTDELSILCCGACGSPNLTSAVQESPSEEEDDSVPLGLAQHRDLVRSVVIAEDFVASASYDLSIKLWDRITGAFLADLTGGHTSRIFCVTMDSTKVISCGEDQRICLWDFAYDIDTSFMKL